jgi:2-methylcitrate dehydratase PrpD
MNSGEMHQLSAVLAQHIACVKYDTLPPATVAATKRAILDGLGVMLAASGLSEEILPFVELARRHGGDPQASILGFAQRVSLPMAAFANGAMAHALDFEDAFDPAPTHPNASLLPAALAVAEARGPISGSEFIVAVAVGCDLVCRLALSLRQPLETGGWYPPPILGAFGATAAASRLLRLSAVQTTDAFSLLLCQNTCPGEIKNSAETVIRAVREAFPAQAAVISALLAERGVTGFAHPLEGENGFFALYAAGNYEPRDLLQGLGERYWIEHLSFKKWPCCRGTHAYIEAAQTLRQARHFALDEIEAITIVGGPLQRMLCVPELQKRSPKTLIDAKFSLPFCVATALAHSEVTLGSFTAATLRDRRLLSLAAKAVFEPAQAGAAPHAAAGTLRIACRDGRAVEHSVARALGDPQRPLDHASLCAKFVDCAARAAIPVGPEAARQLVDRIMNLESQHDVGALLSSRPQ